MDVGDDNSGRRSRRPPTSTDTRTLRENRSAMAWPNRTGLPAHTMPHGAPAPGARERLTARARPTNASIKKTP